MQMPERAVLRGRVRRVAAWVAVMPFGLLCLVGIALFAWHEPVTFLVDAVIVALGVLAMWGSTTLLSENDR